MTYPSTLPDPQEYSFSPRERRRTEASADDPPSFRRFAKDPICDATIRWRFTPDQLEEFTTWYEDEVVIGMKWFEINLPGYDGRSARWARFVSQPTVTHLQVGVFDVSAKLEVRTSGAVTAPIFFSDLILWFDPADSEHITVAGGAVDDATCKVTGTVWSQPFANEKPDFDDSLSVLKAPCFDLSDATSYTRFIYGNPIPCPVPYEAFVVVSWDGTPIAYRGCGLFSAATSDALYNLTGATFLALYRTNSIGSASRRVQFLSSITAYVDGGLDTSPTTCVWNTRVPDTSQNNVSVYIDTTEQPVIPKGAGSLSSVHNYTTLGSPDVTYRSGMKMGEVMVFGRILTSLERSTTMQYLRNKWIPD